MPVVIVDVIQIVIDWLMLVGVPLVVDHADHVVHVILQVLLIYSVNNCIVLIMHDVDDEIVFLPDKHRLFDLHHYHNQNCCSAAAMLLLLLLSLQTLVQTLVQVVI